MATLNKLADLARHDRTYEGAPAVRENKLDVLKRLLYANMLFEDQFYIDGKSATDMLDNAMLAALQAHGPDAVGDVIVHARAKMNIRTASVRMAVGFAKTVGGAKGAQVLTDTIQRVDEIAEALAQVGGKAGMSHAVRRGLARAFSKFDAYQLAKYRGVGKQISLKDAVNLVHPQRTDLIRSLMDGTLKAPDTWEVSLSTGADKRKTFERLLSENRLGAMALLRNLRLMEQEGVKRSLISSVMEDANWSRVMPFRFLAALQTAPSFASEIDAAFRKAVAGSVYLPGWTYVLVDTSASMDHALSAKSKMRRVDAGTVLAAAVNGDRVSLAQFATTAKAVPRFGSLSTVMSIRTGDVGHGTDVDEGLRLARRHGTPDRIIIVSDGQFMPSRLPSLGKVKVYTLNVGSYHSVGVVHGDVTQITGFSAETLRFIGAMEEMERPDPLG